ncbi:hypothetical protein GGG16DRAFT_68213, partial [Schizophyllum commune]
MRFQPEHPQYASHCLKEVTNQDKIRVPVLVGYSIPRSDRSGDEDRHAAAMLTLFSAWSKDITSPVKPRNSSWQDAY